MIRPFTCLCAALAGASGLYLYSEKHRTTLLNEQISQIVQLTDQSRERTSMLRAEWALLNQPDRLQKLSAQFLPNLHPLAPQQFVQLADAAARLPPKEEPKAAPTPDGVMPPADDTAAPPAAPGTDDQAGAVLASALPEKIAPTSDGDATDADSAPATTTLASAGPVGPAIRLPAPPVRLATGRPHTQPAPVRMASARARIIDPTAPAADDASDDAGDPTPAAAPVPTSAPMSTTLASAEDDDAVAPAKPRPKPMAHAAVRPQFADATRRAAPVRAAPAVTQVAYRAPVVRAVAWHPQPTPAHMAAPVAATPASYNSALGGSHAALPPPVPLGG